MNTFISMDVCEGEVLPPLPYYLTVVLPWVPRPLCTSTSTSTSSSGFPSPFHGSAIGIVRYITLLYFTLPYSRKLTPIQSVGSIDS